MKEALTEKDVKEVKEGLKEMGKRKSMLTDRESKRFQELLKANRMPIEISDEDFQMGERELDVRNLSEANYRQLMFRMEVVKANHLRIIDQTLTDILRFEMMILEKQGVDDVIKEHSEFVQKLQEEYRKGE